jgi:hypothetical protein
LLARVLGGFAQPLGAWLNTQAVRDANAPPDGLANGLLYRTLEERRTFSPTRYWRLLYEPAASRMAASLSGKSLMFVMFAMPSPTMSYSFP